MGKFVTLKDIAAETGLTMASVSRALKDNPEIGEETKQQVRKVAGEMGYRPNVFASTLRTGKSKFIGVVVPQNTNPYFASIIADIITIVIDNGYLPLVFNSLESTQIELKAISAMVSFRVAGILTIPVDLNNYVGLPMPVVTMARQFDDEVLDKFDYIINDEKGIDVSVRYLAQRCKRVYYLNGPKEMHSAVVRAKAFKAAVINAGLRYNEDMVIYSSKNDMKGGYESASKLFAVTPKPFAVQCMSDHMAVGVLQALQEFRLSAPDDVAIIGYDDIAYCEYLSVPLSSIRLNQEIGKVAAEFMFKRLENKQLRLRVTVEPKLIIRKSAQW